MLEGASFSEQADCVVDLHKWINERGFVVWAERRIEVDWFMVDFVMFFAVSSES